VVTSGSLKLANQSNFTNFGIGKPLFLLKNIYFLSTIAIILSIIFFMWAKYCIFAKNYKYMRKILVSLSLLTAFAANAQYVSTTSSTAKTPNKSVKSYKPQTGTVTAEFGLAGGLQETSVTLNNNAGLLRFRYFTSDDLAFRIGVSVINKSKTDNVYAGPTGPNAGGTGSQVLKNSGITFNLGAEKHFTGSDRLSTYVGADLLLSSTSAKLTRENTINGTSFSQGSRTDQKGSNSLGNASTGFGLRLVTGAEYYIVKNVYIGAELGFGFLASKFKDVKGSVTTATPAAGGGVTTVVTNIDIKSPGKAFEIAPSVITGVRIGFQF
jgi:hypothetical protein